MAFATPERKKKNVIQTEITSVTVFVVIYDWPVRNA